MLGLYYDSDSRLRVDLSILPDLTLRQIPVNPWYWEPFGGLRDANVTLLSLVRRRYKMSTWTGRADPVIKTQPYGIELPNLCKKLFPTVNGFAVKAHDEKGERLSISDYETYCEHNFPIEYATILEDKFTWLRTGPGYRFEWQGFDTLYYPLPTPIVLQP